MGHGCDSICDSMEHAWGMAVIASVIAWSMHGTWL